jgi:hypothetical protein
MHESGHIRICDAFWGRRPDRKLADIHTGFAWFMDSAPNASNPVTNTNGTSASTGADFIVPA